MGKTIQIMLSLLLFFSLSVQAEWEPTHQSKTPTITPAAQRIADQIAKLPDPLFMTEKDHIKVDELLSTTLYQIDIGTNGFQDTLKEYRTKGGTNAWFRAQEYYLTLHSYSQSKEDLLKLAQSSVYNKLTGFGPYGVTQFKAELHLTELNAQYLLFYQLQSFKAFIKDLTISPVPVIAMVVKLFIVYLLLSWWLRNSRGMIQHFRKTKLETPTAPTIWVRLFWYISKANRPIAWLIAITVSLDILAKLQSLQHVKFLDIFTWWILGGSIAVKFILEFAYRNSRSTTKEITAIRLSTIRYYVWSVIGAGVILQITETTIGEGTIYHWVSSLLFLWFIFITILVLRKWKPYVFSENHTSLEMPVWALWAVDKQNTFGLSTITTATMTFWLITRSLKQFVIANLSQYAFFSQALAYLFRIEVAKQSDSGGNNTNLVKLKGDDIFNYVLPGREDSELIGYACEEIKQISRYILSDSPAMCVVSGERGIGTTTFIKQILYRVNNAEAIYLNCPNSGYAELLSDLAVQIGLDAAATDIQILAYLRKSDTNYLIAVDNAQRLVKPMVGGLTGLMKFTNLMRRSKKNHRVLLAIEKSSWRFVDRARGERLLFDLVTFMPRWSEAEISELLDSRLNQDVENPVSFDDLSLPKQWDQDDISEEERARRGFYRILWHYADGNPTVALRFFRLSLRRDQKTEKVVVRLFQAPQADELEKMPKPMLAILRSIVQLEVSTPEELSECTQLTIAEVIGTLRYFESRGYIEWTADKAKISDHWYRFITNALHRQHLLVK
ncbi:ATP-binding protein [Vibrio rumoiensis]|uniref:AAA family ATPase n=1 Tax=Vibrio rumoiensis 1S-45 TaxID=1188252 RepID=A0A1E5E6M4_9VIBR|nr:ATP-binding protein [Vibrio rumoiensis]OEF30167.1 AAA family ATPase [Vibrio rumoiensis 1S-45]